MPAPEHRPEMPDPLPAPDLLADELSVLLHEADAPAAPPTPARRRLFARVMRSAAAARRMHTLRHADAAPQPLGEGVGWHALYDAPALTLRPGEPQRCGLLELAPGARWLAGPTDSQREWLVLRGAATLGDIEMQGLDFHLQPARAGALPLHSAGGALLLVREAPAWPGASPLLQRAADATWADYAPGIERRVLVQHDGQAAMLYRTRAGAAVPRHGHRHDEECLMLAGDLFLDEVLLRPLDYQLAPAGTHHDSVSTDTGVLLYAHGDLDLDLQSA